ncbi:MAG: hypothetical protein KKA62_02305 [Nanoarchaeota archaeon]|nr:hypothetical protein [Nanoarchaeota archaeon]MBU1643668.1 hypothetical protein [Nanoarchaeota archaeon]MBU1976766.1 hypothetical protein [Nanoarchaeota archaeon]
MKITVDKKVFREYPNLKIAFVLVKKINNKSKVKDSVELLSEIEKFTQLTFNKDTIKTHGLISPWRTAQEEFGKKAKHYHTSIEKLMQKVIAKKKISGKDAVTNLARYLALKHIIPYGIDDYDKLKGELSFKVAEKKEKLTFLKKLEQGDLYYRDSKSVLGTKLDYWKNKKTIPNSHSSQVLIHFEALPPISPKKLKEVVKETAELVKSFCGGESKSFFLDKKNNFKKI